LYLFSIADNEFYRGEGPCPFKESLKMEKMKVLFFGPGVIMLLFRSAYRGYGIIR